MPNNTNPIGCHKVALPRAQRGNVNEFVDESSELNRALLGRVRRVGILSSAARLELGSTGKVSPSLLRILNRSLDELIDAMPRRDAASGGVGSAAHL